MKLLEIRNIKKSYKNDESELKVLKGISLSFSSNGFIGIIGKSGCGKSTLLNIIASYEKPDEGHVFYYGENIGKFKKRKVNKYRNKEIGFLFQHYNLINDLDCVENIALPMMIDGKSEKRSYQDAETLLKAIDFPTNLYHNNIKDLSGGERQRIAFLRALINDPKILLCDEPTGALDSKNSERAMELLKKCSKDKLVIVVSHNKNLINKYANRIIEIKNGEVFSDTIKNELCNECIEIKQVKNKNKNKSIDFLLRKDLKKTKKKNVISLISIVIGLTTTLISCGFINGSKKSVENQTKMHLDYGVSTISKIVRTNNGSGPSIIKTFKPTDEELLNLSCELDQFIVANNYDYLVPSYLKMQKDDNEVEGIAMSPIYDFDSKYIDKSLLLEGRMPADSLNECLINTKAKDYLVSSFGDWKVTLLCSNIATYVHKDDDGEYGDYFEFKEAFKIVGVVEELEFLSSSKLYYSFKKMDLYLSERIAENASLYYGRETSWKDAVSLSSKNENISSFSYRLFAKNINNVDYEIEFKNNDFELTSLNYEISNSLSQLISSTKDGVLLFFFIVLIGSLLICGVVNYSEFSDKRHDAAILFSLGSSSGDITDIFSCKSIILGLISLIISIGLSLILELISNVIIQNATGFKSVIKIPWTNFYGYPYLFIALLFIGVVVFSLLTSSLPVLFSKRVSIKEELMDE